MPLIRVQFSSSLPDISKLDRLGSCSNRQGKGGQGGWCIASTVHSSRLAKHDHVTSASYGRATRLPIGMQGACMFMYGHVLSSVEFLGDYSVQGQRRNSRRAGTRLPSQSCAGVGSRAQPT
jgi:hypothetical protein